MCHVVLLHALYTRLYIFPDQLSLNKDALPTIAPHVVLPGAHLCVHPAGLLHRDCERAGVTSGAPP